MKNGDCCSDYQFCEAVEESHTTSTSISNCKFSTIDKSICLQCQDSFFYYNNTCLKGCNEDQVVNSENRLCIDKNDCDQKNCEKCGSDGKCERCFNGFFLFEESCVSICPKGYRADRKEFRCQEKKEYSFYWIFPSRAGCKDKCGVDHIKADCSCTNECLRQGNCCDDFEKECKDELLKENCKLCQNCVDGRCARCKKNSEPNNLDEGLCQCKKGYDYDLRSDQCLKKDSEQIIQNTNNTINSTCNILTKPQLNQSKDNDISTEKENTTTVPISDTRPESGKNITNANNEEMKQNVTKNNSYISDASPSTPIEPVPPIIKTNDKFINKTQSENHTQYEECSNNTKKIKKQKKIKSKKNITRNLVVNNCSNDSSMNSSNNINIPHLYPINSKVNKTSLTEKIPVVDNNLAEELLKSFKNVFSMQNPENKNQILNLYMNGNISINVLTGNTNPQLITQNVYNKDSYNKINHDVKNIDSGNQLISIPENINKTLTPRFRDITEKREENPILLIKKTRENNYNRKTRIENNKIIKINN
jgi:hypothetical protein